MERKKHYPSWRYHADGRSVIVKNEAEEQALGAGWGMAPSASEPASQPVAGDNLLTEAQESMQRQAAVIDKQAKLIDDLEARLADEKALREKAEERASELHGWYLNTISELDQLKQEHAGLLAKLERPAASQKDPDRRQFGRR